MVTQHVLSFDVENWYDGNLHRRWTWRDESANHRLLAETYDVLDLLEQHSIRATFFILGRVAGDHPYLVRRIAAAGHEVACHAYEHVMVRDAGPEGYLDQLRRGRALLQDLSGQPVPGHRAPSWSVDRHVPWAVDAIAAAGFAYDSSIFPMRTPLYGEPGLPGTPFRLAGPGGGQVVELPPAVHRSGPVSVPFGGGVYFRVLPARLVLWLLRAAPAAQVMYLHPWELNPAPVIMPRGTPLLPRLVLRFGVGQARAKLRWLLERCRFGTMVARVQELEQSGMLPTFSLGGG